MAHETLVSQIQTYTDDYTFETVSIADIKSTSHEFQNRRGDIIDKSNVEQMAYALMENVVLPPVLLRRTDSGDLAVIDGNHRIAVRRELDIPTIDAFVVRCDDRTYRYWVGRANIYNGRDVGDPKTRLAMAADEVLNQGIQVASAARAWAVSEATLGTEVRVRRGTVNLVAAKLGAQSSSVSKAVKQQLHDMEPEHIAELGALLSNATADEVKQAKRAIASVPSKERTVAAKVAARQMEASQVSRRGKPNAQAPYTAAMAKAALTKLRNGVASNRAIVNDLQVVKRVELLLDVFGLEVVRKDVAA